jgi:uncharacterized cupin superfamily protein
VASNTAHQFINNSQQANSMLKMFDLHAANADEVKSPVKLVGSCQKQTQREQD